MITSFPQPDFRILIFDDADALAREAARRFTVAAGRAVDAGAMCRVALAGGHTPLATYRILAAEPYVYSVHWPSLQIFWGDERFVPHDHPESNYGAAQGALLDHLPVPPGGVFPVPTDAGNPGTAAAAYQQTLVETLETLPPELDLVLLGLGADGHTASLFPGALPEVDGGTLVAATHSPAGIPERVTFTPSLLNAARQVLFLVSGESKAEALEQVLRAKEPDPSLPATLVRPVHGKVTWLVDRAAAARTLEGAGDADENGDRQGAAGSDA